MRQLRILLPVLAALSCAALAVAAPLLGAYQPQAQYCFPQAQTVDPADSPLCSVIPGDISPDPLLAGKGVGYQGLVGNVATAPASDVETPFDNFSWQTFVGLNWAGTQVQAPARVGLDGNAGPRVWEGWQRVSAIFGNATGQANCNVPAGYRYFSMGSDGKGNPVSQNEEYIQAATARPAIDVLGNYTLYERRVNGVEAAYLAAPVKGQASWNLNTYDGQVAFANGGGQVDFPASGPTQNGAMEIKAAWRILDPAHHADNVKRYYAVRAVVGVAPDLIDRPAGAKPAPICATVDLGLVAMHIIQKNVDSHNRLEPKWFWSTFEHVDNAPLATAACDITKPSKTDCTLLNQTGCPVAGLPPGAPSYSYFDPRGLKAQTNFPADGGKAFHWNPGVPYAQKYLQGVPGSPLRFGSQITRCFQLYRLTQSLNAQWQAQLRRVGSVFANYMLIGTQWGASLEPTNPPSGPPGVVPNYLSNTVLETYLQTFWAPGGKYSPFTTGSCISCHSAARLVAKKGGTQDVPANFSFLPELVTSNLIRTVPTLTANPPPKK